MQLPLTVDFGCLPPGGVHVPRPPLPEAVGMNETRGVQLMAWQDDLRAKFSC